MLMLDRLRRDKGAVGCIRAHQSTAMVVVMVNCTYYERMYFSPSDDIVICSSDRGGIIEITNL